jgi:hypothetical protein
MLLVTANAGDMLRKSIVFDKNTPDVFYCPVHKPTGFDKMIVKAKPLSRLCQFEGGPIPKDYKSDCYNDVDESEYACKEKYRIMVRIPLGLGAILFVNLRVLLTRRPRTFYHLLATEASRSI